MKNLKSLLNVPKAEVKVDGNVLVIDGVIGDFFDELDSKSVNEKIDAIDGDITVCLNSPGGDVFAGISIMDHLKAHKGKITVVVEGLAASIASVIAIGAADELRMAEGSMLMIHNAWTGMIGNANDMRKAADVLDTLSGNIADIYAKHCKKPKADITAAMDAETWFTASGAAEFGFNVVTEEHEAKLKNFAMLSSFNCVPDSYKVNSPVSKPATVRDLETSLHSLGYSRNEAKAIASQVSSVQQRDVANTDSEMLNKLGKAISERKQIFN